MLDTGSGVHDQSQPGLWTPMPVPLFLGRALCAAGPAGLWEGDRAPGTPCTAGGEEWGLLLQTPLAAIILGLS